MPIASRLFSGDADRDAVRELIIAAVANGRHTSYFQVGDLIWGVYQNTIFDPFRYICLWADEDGELLGFTWFQPPDFIVLQLHPRRYGDEALEAQMLDWGQERRRESLEVENSIHFVRCHAYKDDVTRLGLLARRGFERCDDGLVHMERDLERPIPDHVPPDGFIVRHVGEQGEWGERVEIHREVWHPSKVTLDAYRRLRSIPGYTPQLDLVAAAPDGTFASYCICWLDSANKCGEFEPVGTRPAFRGKRLGQAVMLEGLRRLKAYGANTAIVYSYGDNEAAIKLYESVGFGIVKREHFYRKRV